MPTKDWKSTLILPSSRIIDALSVIDSGALQIALVVDENGRLVGTLTDGDVRRAILEQVSLQEPVEKVMFRTPTVARLSDDRETILDKMRRKELRHIPVVDDDGCVVDLKVLLDMVQAAGKANTVVLMAGGLGKRLRPLTDDCPKPLLKVGGRAILETILRNFIEYGFSRFFFSVNYKAEMIVDHFGDGSQFGVSISYLQETKELGTAGALGLLPDRPTEPIIVMNGDLLTKINFHYLLQFHHDHQAAATMCVREYDFQVPYGVVHVDRHKLVRLVEKPTQSFFINAGIYVLEPPVLDQIPRDVRFDMTDLFEKVIELKQSATVFPVREYWLDIGRMPDFENANGEFWTKYQPRKDS